MQDKLQKLQNRAACVLTYSYYDADVNNLFELLRWKSLVSQRQIERATIVFKSQGLVSEYLFSKFVHQDSGYCLRDSGNNVTVNSKTTHAPHPPPPANPRAFDFFEKFWSNSPLSCLFRRSNAPPVRASC